MLGVSSAALLPPQHPKVLFSAWAGARTADAKRQVQNREDSPVWDARTRSHVGFIVRRASKGGGRVEQWTSKPEGQA